MGWGKTWQPTPEENIGKKIHGQSLVYDERWPKSRKQLNKIKR